MQKLYDEVVSRFPEVGPFVEGYESLPYLAIGAIVDWLRSVARPTIDPSIVKRVVEFDRWCMTQPGGRSAKDDLATIEMVSLREKLFRYDELLPLIPALMNREELLQNRDYLVPWVGADRYELALRLARKTW